MKEKSGFLFEFFRKILAIDAKILYLCSKNKGNIKTKNYEDIYYQRQGQERDHHPS